LQRLGKQLQTVPGVSLVTGAAEASGYLDSLTLFQALGLLGHPTRQNHGDAGLDFTGMSVFQLPGAMFQPDSLTGHSGWSQGHLFQGDDHTSEFAVVAFQN